MLQFIKKWREKFLLSALSLPGVNGIFSFKHCKCRLCTFRICKCLPSCTWSSKLIFLYAVVSCFFFKSPNRYFIILQAVKILSHIIWSQLTWPAEHCTGGMPRENRECLWPFTRLDVTKIRRHSPGKEAYTSKHRRQIPMLVQLELIYTIQLKI